MFHRILNIPKLLEKKSFFLFGPRSTGKSTLIAQQLNKEEGSVIDLLESRLFLKLQQDPSELENLFSHSPQPKFVVIDEIQRIPELLNEVHRLIETKKYKFLLTGSSARKLKRGNVNLLAGRAWSAELFPLVYKEIPEFDLQRYLRFGGLPQVYLSQDPEEELDAYVHTYLREEISAEALIRKLAPFTRFLKTIALSNGEILNFTKIGNDSQVHPNTVTEFVHILEDTLVGFLVQPFVETQKRKAIRTAKFYFFDTGVSHTLAQTEFLDRNSNLYGKSFEQFIAMELRAYLSYFRKKKSLTFWRSTHGVEVDFLIGKEIAIEVKSATRVTASDFKGLEALSEEGIFKKFFLISQDPISNHYKSYQALHWKSFLDQLWDGKVI